MLGIIIMLALSPPAASAPVSVPPPVPQIVQVDRPPPIVAVRQQQPSAFLAFPVEIEMRSATEILWAGTLRVSNTNGSSYNMERSEPPLGACDDRSYRVIQTQIRLNLNFQRNESMPDRLGVSATWKRPASSEGCSESRTSRTVMLEDMVALPPGATQQIKGDAGLVITLRRR